MFFQRINFSALSILFFGILSISSADAETQFVEFTDSNLQQGRTIWIENCKGCHAYGTAGAPIPMIAEEWQVRVIKPRNMLYDHAINGFFGPDDTMMPERGGNPDLSDQQVKSAVDYMLALAKHYITLKKD